MAPCHGRAGGEPSGQSSGFRPRARRVPKPRWRDTAGARRPGFAVSRAVTDPEVGVIAARGLLRSAVLLLLREEATHGYELMGRLTELGVEVPPTSGGLYRALRAMADEGLATAEWVDPGQAPPRRVYAITELGERHLEALMASLARLACSIDRMLHDYRSRR